VQTVDAEDAVGRRIARARKLCGLTQTGLAGRAHLSKNLIAQVESGHKPQLHIFLADSTEVATTDGTQYEFITVQAHPADDPQAAAASILGHLHACR
jgi:transcriptional regulator with XRE-family HTH domain